MRRLLALAAPILLASPLGAQSLLYRPPTVNGTWVPDAGVVQFNFLHRFYVSPGPYYAVSNFPTFTFSGGLGHGLALGLMYGSRTGVQTSSGSSNEIQPFLRWRLWGGDEGSTGAHVSLTPAYNFAAQSVDGEAAVDWTRGRFTLNGAVRMVQHALGPDSVARVGVAGGANVRLTRYIALSGDYGTFTSGDRPAAWSAAVNFLIPGAPHTFSLQAGNARTTTIQGASVGCNKATCGTAVFYGFEFTIPLHLKRFAPWFGKEPTRTTNVRMYQTMAVAVEAEMRAMSFRADSIVIRAGQSVRWTNRDPLVHTVTFDDASVAGSTDIRQGEAFVKTFDTPGRYSYHCTPHPAMTGVVVVQ